MMCQTQQYCGSGSADITLTCFLVHTDLNDLKSNCVNSLKLLALSVI